MRKTSTFKDRFSWLLKESGRTATQTAKDLGVSQQSISTWRTGVRSPKGPTLAYVADYFNVNVMWLAGYDVPMEAPESPDTPDFEPSRCSTSSPQRPSTDLVTRRLLIASIVMLTISSILALSNLIR